MYSGIARGRPAAIGLPGPAKLVGGLESCQHFLGSIVRAVYGDNYLELIAWQCLHGQRLQRLLDQDATPVGRDDHADAAWVAPLGMAVWVAQDAQFCLSCGAAGLVVFAAFIAFAIPAALPRSNSLNDRPVISLLAKSSRE